MTDGKTNIACVECRSTTRHISRRYNGHAFCSTCYAREFKHKECPKCHKIARLPRFNDTAICRTCETDKPCIRCGKTKYSTGKITQYGPVCNACSLYYRETKICPSCKNESQALSKSKHLDHDMAVCPKCQRSAHKICMLCRRHRLVTIVNNEPICKKCLTQDPSICSTCDSQIPAGRGTECENCYRRRLLAKRANFNLNGIKSQQIKIIYQHYSQWLPESINPLKASIVIDQDYQFFKKLDSIWGFLPSYEILLEYFDPEGLRKNLRVMRFLHDQGFIKIDETLKKEHSEKHQIKRLLLSIEADTLTEKIINTFYQQQLDRLSEGKTSYRSIRLALGASIDLLRLLKSNNDYLSQNEIDRFLIMKPGQRSNITGFVNHLKKLYDLTLSLDTSIIVSNKKQLEKMLLSMMFDKRDSKTVSEDLWVKVSLAYYHDLLVTKSSKFFVSKTSDNSFNITYKEERYFIPGIFSS